MNDFSPPDLPRSPPMAPLPSLEEITQGGSSLYRLFEAFIALREKNERQHKLFEQALVKTRDAIQASFNSFAGDTQRAYQQLRQEVHGEKRISLVLLNELMEIGFDLEQITTARPRMDFPGEKGEAATRWADAVEVQCRKVGAALIRHGIHRYDAVIGAPYNPAMHERVGSKRMEGMEALRVAEQTQHGFASQQPEFVLRRPKVIVTE
jgi:molecular chaperone GrpE (heat shock protein)